MNELVKINSLDISKLDDQDVDIIYQQIMQRKFNNMLARQEQMEDSMKKLEARIDINQTELENRIEDMKIDNEKKLEVTINTYRVDKNKWGFESQADFGNRFRVSIGSKTVGKLFKVIGIAKKSKKKTEPTRDVINSGKSTTEIVKGYETFRWHHEKCIKQLEKWLLEHDLLEEFYSIDKENDLQIFINSLYDTYIISGEDE